MCLFQKAQKCIPTLFPTPMSLYNSTASNGTLYMRHNDWLSLIRDRIWARIHYEEEMIPSCDALSRHWKRACWVFSVWSQSTANVMTYPPLENHGWKQPQQNTLTIDWDSENNVTSVKERVALIRRDAAARLAAQPLAASAKREVQTYQ